MAFDLRVWIECLVEGGEDGAVILVEGGEEYLGMEGVHEVALGVVGETEDEEVQELREAWVGLEETERQEHQVGMVAHLGA